LTVVVFFSEAESEAGDGTVKADDVCSKCAGALLDEGAIHLVVLSTDLAGRLNPLTEQSINVWWQMSNVA
jgi:hypothetical protein